MDFSTKLAVVVNASVDVLKLIREVLEQSQIKTVFFFGPQLQSDASGFLAFVEAHKPDLVLFDVPMPYDENLRLMSSLRQRAADQKFLVMTTSPDTVHSLIEAEPSLGEGIVDIVVGKPFNLDELLEAVQEGFSRSPKNVRVDGA